MYPEYVFSLADGTVHWRCEYEDFCRLECRDSHDRLLALETEESGLHIISDGVSWRAGALFDERATMEITAERLSWSRSYPEHGAIVHQTWERLDEDTLKFSCILEATRTIRKPHLSYGLRLILPPYFSRFSYAHNPTQMGYTFQNGNELRTLWLYSLPPDAKTASLFAGCQALVAENPDPATLEFHLRLPPGYNNETSKEYQLEAGQTVSIIGALALRQGPFYSHAECNEKLLTRQVLPAHHSYRDYISLSLENFLDPRKYHQDNQDNADDGITYYSAVDGSMDKPQFQYWTEGPSWGGACEAENGWNMLLCARHFPAQKEELTAHARRMLHGWLNNKRYRVPDDVYEHTAGDMADAYVTTGWFRDCIWTIAQADLILRLADTHLETKWSECLPEARKIATWLLRHQAEDGSLPTIWQFPIVYPKELLEGWRPVFSRCTRSDHRAQVLVGPQPPSACFLSLALRRLAEADPENADKWSHAAARLMDWAIEQLRPALAEFGNGECDYLVYRTKSIDPTGIAYILRGLARQYRITPTPEIFQLVRRFMDIYSCFSVHWDCEETRLRPIEKCNMSKYGADIKLAGGITHGNWQPIYKRGFSYRFNLLMNRNEIADAMLDAWQITKSPRDLAMLRAYINWQTYFQFTNEVPNSPVTTKGSCQQNHFWTTDFGNWNNDYALTAFKWTGTFWNLLEAGIDK